jgi:hypothetical protein
MEELLYADGFDDCILGTTDGAPTVVVYDAMKMIEQLVNRDGMTSEEALEYFEYNIAGAYVGERTPVFVWKGHER